MSKTSLGFLHYGDLFEFDGRIYKVGKLIENTNGYVACVDTETHKVTRLYIDTTVDEMPQSEWIKMTDNYGHSSYFCSRCGTQEGKTKNICPNCNADMRGMKNVVPDFLIKG